MLNIRLQKFAHIEGLDVLYFSLGLMLCLSVPIASVGPSFAVWPNLAMFAAVGLSVMAIRDLPVVIRSMSVTGRCLLLIIPVYLVLGVLLGLFRFGVQLQYPLWTLSVFFLWLLVIPWLFYKKGGSVICALAWGGLIGSGINAIAIVVDVYWAPTAPMLYGYLVDISHQLPWDSTFDNRYHIGFGRGGGFFSYSRTTTGFFLGVSTALCFSLIHRPSWRLAFQMILLLGILYSGSRLGFLSWLFVMFVGYRNIGVLRGSGIVLGVIVFFLLGLYFGFFNMYQQGRLIGARESFQDALSVRWLYQSQAIPHDLLSLQTFFGSGAGMSAITMGWNKLGFNMYEAHGAIYQYLADVGLIGFILYLAVVGRVLKEHWRQVAVWGLVLSFGLSHIVDDLFFPKPQAVYLPIVFAIIFIMVGSQPDKKNKNDRSNSQEVS